MITWQRGVGAAGLLACWLSLAGPAVQAQSYSSVQLKDLKNAPHIFWAKGVIFRDVLEEMPREKVEKLAGREVSRFRTRELGEVYADAAILPSFAAFETGTDYYFSGTVAQKGRRYYYIVNNISRYTNDVETATTALASLNRELATNDYNKVFMILEDVIQDAQDELFKASTTTGIPLAELIGNPEHRIAAAQAVRAALRKFETISKTTSQEFFVSVIVSMMAAQYGYADTSPESTYSPEALPVEDPAPEAAVEEIKEEEWDLSTSGAVQVELSGEAPAGDEPPDALIDAPAPVQAPADPVDLSDLGDEPPDAVIEEPTVVAPTEAVTPVEETEPPDAIIEPVESREPAAITEPVAEPAPPDAGIATEDAPVIEAPEAEGTPVAEAKEVVEEMPAPDESPVTESEAVSPEAASISSTDEAPDAIVEEPAAAAPEGADEIDYSQPMRLR